MKNKQQQIEEKLAKPIVEGDYVAIEVPYSYKETVTEGRGKKKETKTVIKEAVFKSNGYVKKIVTVVSHGVVYIISMGSTRVPSEVYLKNMGGFEGYDKFEGFKAEHVKPTVVECGANPFKKERFRVDFYNKEIASLLFAACYGKRFDDGFENPQYTVHTGNGTEKDKEFKGKTYGGVDFNPYVIDADGKKKHYQRELVWTLKQNQLLIDSIYNGIEIGKFLFRYKSWKRMEEQMASEGHGYSWECVDGKQRFFAILHFVQNKYPDSFGNYWNDLSENAQRKFLDYHNLSYGEMREAAQDSDVIETFLTLNFTGTPMSQQHIEYVQNFKM